MSDLTPAQWELYRYLKENYSPERFISKAEICEALPNWYQMKENETRTCRDIEFDVRAINDDETIQKIIVSNNKGYKIGDKDQVDTYLTSRMLEALRSLKLTWKLLKKAKANNQCRITFGAERDYIEAFMREEIKNANKQSGSN